MFVDHYCFVVFLLYSSDIFFFFFKQKTAYEMRISDWSSDVCSSDLHQRMITRRLERIGQAGKHPEPGVMDHRRLAMHDRLGAHHRATERLPQRLMTKTYTEDRHPTRQRGNQLRRPPGLLARARPRRPEEPR